MGLGISNTYVENIQDQESAICQQVSNSCDINCRNSINDLTIEIIDSKVGNISVSQACTVDASCVQTTNVNAIIDTIFTAKNSANAKATCKFLGIEYDSVTDISRQEIHQRIDQYITNTCNISSVNEMNNVLIFSDNSEIKNIQLSQTGDVKGSCVLNTTLKANTYASGTSQQDASSGKDKKKNKDGIGKAFMYMVIAGFILAVLGIGLKVYLANKKDKSQMKQNILESQFYSSIPSIYSSSTNQKK